MSSTRRTLADTTDHPGLGALLHAVLADPVPDPAGPFVHTLTPPSDECEPWDLDGGEG